MFKMYTWLFTTSKGPYITRASQHSNSTIALRMPCADTSMYYPVLGLGDTNYILSSRNIYNNITSECSIYISYMFSTC